MGRNRPAFTGHTELRKTFQRKGVMGKNEKGTEVRTYIVYTQIEHKESYGYIYEVNYDGHVFYQTFMERYIQNDEGATIVNYPNDDAFRENEWQWAWNTRTLEAAKEILETFACVYQ
jgi:hypothetical protein